MTIYLIFTFPELLYHSPMKRSGRKHRP